MKTHLTSKAALAERAAVDAKTITSWMRRADFPKRGAKGWDASAFDAYTAKALRAAMKRQTGENADLKRLKLQRQIDLLEVSISAAKRADALAAGKLIDVEEHLEEMRTLARLFADVGKLFISNVRVMTGDIKLITEAERINDRMLARVRELILAEGHKANKTPKDEG